MSTSLDELAQFVRQTLPQSSAIQHLQMRADAGVISFSWNGREFLVKPSLQVFETRGRNIMITGASILMQVAFLKKQKTEKVLVATADSLKQVEDLLKAQQTEQGLTLLVMLKKTLTALVGK